MWQIWRLFGAIALIALAIAPGLTVLHMVRAVPLGYPLVVGIMAEVIWAAVLVVLGLDAVRPNSAMVLVHMMSRVLAGKARFACIAGILLSLLVLPGLLLLISPPITRLDFDTLMLAMLTAAFAAFGALCLVILPTTLSD